MVYASAHAVECFDVVSGRVQQMKVVHGHWSCHLDHAHAWCAGAIFFLAGMAGKPRHACDQCLTAYSFIYFLAGAIAAEDTDGLTKWGPIAVVVVVLLACAAFAGTIVLLSGGPGGDPPPLGRKGCAAAVIGERQVRHNSPRSEML